MCRHPAVTSTNLPPHLVTSMETNARSVRREGAGDERPLRGLLGAIERHSIHRISIMYYTRIREVPHRCPGSYLLAGRETSYRGMGGLWPGRSPQDRRQRFWAAV